MILEIARNEAITFVNTQMFENYPLLKNVTSFKIYNDFLSS